MFTYRTMVGVAFCALTVLGQSATASTPIVSQTAPAAKTTQPVPPIVRPKPAPVTRADFITRLDAQFDQIDLDHDGTITRAELDAAQVKRNARITTAETQRAQTRFKQLDTNNDGQLSMAEFTAPIASRKVIANGAAALTRLDTNKDGKLSRDEFRAQPLANFDRLDSDRNGSITPGERPKPRRR